MKPDYQDLWDKILHFELDDPTANIKFSDKLSFQNNWSKDFCEKAITEYKKFIFLCCTSPNGASPSPIVDEVWHLHLTYTENYWKKFCGETLGKEIHHYPSKGGESESNRHKNWYLQTLQSYKEVFGEDAPVEIWPPAQKSTTHHVSFQDVSGLNYSAAYKKYLYLLALPFLIPLFLNKLHPFALTGPVFLLFYAFLLSATAVFMFFVRKQKVAAISDAIEDTALNNTNIYEVARFIYGKNKVIETAIVDLVSKNILTVERGRKLSFNPAKMDSYTLKQNPLAQNLLRLSKPDELLRMDDLASFYNDNLTFEPRLLDLYKRVVRKDFIRFFLLAFVVIIGAIRMNQGLNNHYPVKYLGLIIMIGGVILLSIVTNLSSKLLLQNVLTQKHKTNTLVLSHSEPLLSKFVFIGLMALPGLYAFTSLENIFKSYTPERATASSSCGSSGCGSSCGGGCDGGCGGCGGGD